jgi:prolipoprotein diacylglyceryltransferase
MLAAAAPSFATAHLLYRLMNFFQKTLFGWETIKISIFIFSFFFW